MRALVLSDIHGNLPALEAVLAASSSAAVGGFDELWNLGDMVGYGAQPNEVLDTLRAVPTRRTIHVRGNHDRVSCGLTSSHGFNPMAAAAAAWTHATLTEANRAWLCAVPQGPIIATERVLCAHGSPLHEDQYITSMRDAWAPLQRMTNAITFFGHTHVQGCFGAERQEWQEERPRHAGREGLDRFVMELPPLARYLINPGSVGQPRDGDWRAAFALYEEPASGPGIVTLFRTPYDVERAQRTIRAAKLPERLAARLTTGR